MANLLSESQVLSAIKYNQKQGFSSSTIEQFQSVVGTDPDGDIGPKTVQAIARFQAKHGLTVDGKIGSQTRAALDSAQPPGDSQDKPGKTDDPKDDKPLQDGRLTIHFRLDEFRCHDGSKIPTNLIPRLKELAQNLEVLRTAAGGRSISLNSGYRSPTYNQKIGGAKNSQHVQGRAADFNVAGMTPTAVRQLIEKLITQGRMKQGGLGRYSSFVHYDTRGYRSRW